MKVVLWGSLAFIAYTYFIYPIAVIIAASFKKRRDPGMPTDPELPNVSLIIAAYNEEKVLEEKIRNSLLIDYPKEKLQVVIVSDGSNDRTREIAERYAPHGVLSLHQSERKGKTAALNRAVSRATGEILTFSDANTFYNPLSLKMMVRHFRDPEIGGVCGLKSILPAEGRKSSLGDDLYWRYESAIKEAESDIHSIVAADGEIFSMRRSIYRPIDETMINDDAAMTFDIIRSGGRILYEREAVSREYASITLSDDFYVKVRMVAGGFQTIAAYARDLFPPRTLFSWQFISHKVLRWLVPEFLLLALLSSVLLSMQSQFLYIVLSGLQFFFYTLAAVGHVQARAGRVWKVFYIPLYFTVMNLAALLGLIRFLRREQSTSWRKAKR